MLGGRAIARAIGVLMQNILRTDESEILVTSNKINSDDIILVFAGFGYTLDQPYLYYSIRLATELGFKCIGFDLQYYANTRFLKLNEKEQDEYFENDIASIENFIKNNDLNKTKIAIGKSLGTTIISRLIKNEVLNKQCDYVLFTPGTEWNNIIPIITNNESRTFIVGSKADKNYIVENLNKIYNRKNIIVNELKNENHSLETLEVINDIGTLHKIMSNIKKYIEEKST